MRSKRLFTNRAPVVRLELAFALLAAAMVAHTSGTALACPRAETVPAPTVEEAGFEPLRIDQGGSSGGHLWVRFAPADALLTSFYVLEPVGGRPPPGLAAWWGRPLAAEGAELVVPIDSPTRAYGSNPSPSLFAFQARAVLDGRMGEPSRPVWISIDSGRPGRAATAVQRADRILYFLLAVALGFLWYWYRREPTADGKIRLAALAALASVVFLSVTAAMPWLMIDASAFGRAAPVECLLGEEATCVQRAGAAMLAAASDPGQVSHMAFEVQRWQCASAALRMGQVTALALLLPALVWLLVDPRHRAAQAAAAVGASVAGFALMVVMLYRHSVPSWLDAEPYWTADIAVLTTSAIVVAAVLIVRQSFSFLQRSPLPAAFAHYRRRRR